MSRGVEVSVAVMVRSPSWSASGSRGESQVRRVRGCGEVLVTVMVTAGGEAEAWVRVTWRAERMSLSWVVMLGGGDMWSWWK